MSIRHIIIIILCFMQTSCLSIYLVSDIELKAHSHMELAAAKENSSNFQEAIREYSIISRKYPGTSCYKPAVWKAALLNFHPDNPEIDYMAALDWLEIYSNLPLSTEEEEITVLYTALIMQINLTMAEKEKFAALIEQQSRNIATLNKKLKQVKISASQARDELKKLSDYETELSILREKLQKMKEIDVQMHKRKF